MPSSRSAKACHPIRSPPDAVTASGSGLDPAISVAYADLQAARVARNTGVPLDRVKQLIAANTFGARNRRSRA